MLDQFRFVHHCINPKRWWDPPAGIWSSCRAVRDEVMVVKPPCNYRFGCLQQVENKKISGLYKINLKNFLFEKTFLRKREIKNLQKFNFRNFFSNYISSLISSNKMSICISNSIMNFISKSGSKSISKSLSKSKSNKINNSISISNSISKVISIFLKCFFRME